MNERRTWIYLVYDLALRLVSLLLGPWLLFRAWRDRGFRRGLRGRLALVASLPKASQRILLHGVSVGEVKALRPLVGHLHTALPDAELVITSSTPSGLETAKQAFPELLSLPFPLDFSGTCRRFLRRVRPTSVVLAELEIWPNFLRHCSLRQIPVAIVNGRITERSMGGYRRVQRLLPQFDRIRLYCVQNQTYAERFRALDVSPDSVVVTGNLKYDSLPAGGTPAKPPWPLWIKGAPAVVIASTHEPEETEVVPLLADGLGPEVRIVVVPRHPHRAMRLARDLTARLANRVVCLRSEVNEDHQLPTGCVLVVDSFGELESIYGVVDAAFVGGSLVDHGGQNVLEAAAFGLPIVVGPHTVNFAEEVALLEASGGLVRADGVKALLESLRTWLQDPPLARAAGSACRAALDSQRGATLRSFNALDQAGMFRPQGISPKNDGKKALHV